MGLCVCMRACVCVHYGSRKLYELAHWPWLQYFLRKERVTCEYEFILSQGAGGCLCEEVINNNNSEERKCCPMFRVSGLGSISGCIHFILEVLDRSYFLRTTVYICLLGVLTVSTLLLYGKFLWVLITLGKIICKDALTSRTKEEVFLPWRKCNIFSKQVLCGLSFFLMEILSIAKCIL